MALHETLEEPNPLKYYHHLISTGPLKGINNKIKALKGAAY